MSTTNIESLGFTRVEPGGTEVNNPPDLTAPIILTGSGVPTVEAPKGSLYLRSDGSGQTYQNTDGGTTWALVSTGGGGGITGSLTTGMLPVADGVSSLTDSVLLQDGGNITSIPGLVGVTDTDGTDLLLQAGGGDGTGKAAGNLVLTAGAATNDAEAGTAYLLGGLSETGKGGPASVLSGNGVTQGDVILGTQFTQHVLIDGTTGTLQANTVWNSASTYRTGDVVLDRGGVWQAAGPNANSRPVSGNTDWSLVGGSPYVETLLDPVALATAPFFDATSSGPGLSVVPAPGSGMQLVVDAPVAQQTPGDAWGLKITVNWALSAPTSAYNLVTIQPDMAADLATVAPVQIGEPPGGSSPVPPAVDEPVVIWTPDDITDGGATFGTRSLRLRTYYRIIPITTGDTFFTISAVNQTPKTLTVNGDASGLGATFDIVGNTGGNDGTYTKTSATFSATTSGAITGIDQGTKTFTIAGNHVAAYLANTPVTVTGSSMNDGTYTLVSATLNAGDTDLVVVEAIVDNTLDGTIGHPDQTAVVTVEAIPFATADGWVKQ